MDLHGGNMGWADRLVAEAQWVEIFSPTPYQTLPTRPGLLTTFLRGEVWGLGRGWPGGHLNTNDHQGTRKSETPFLRAAGCLVTSSW